MKWHKKRPLLIVPICFIFVIFFEITSVLAIDNNTKNEKDYLSEKKVLKVSVLDDWRPYVYKENDTYKGITIEVLKNLQKNTGIELEFIPAESYSKSMEELKKGKIDIAAINLINDRDSNKEERGISFVPYFKVPIQILAYKDDKLVKKENLVIAQLKGTKYLEVEKYPSISVIEYDSIEKCIDSVRSKQTDFTCMDMYMATLFMEQLKSRDFILKNIPEHDIIIGFGIAGEKNNPLIKLLEKEIDSFDTAERSELINLEREGLGGIKWIISYIYTHPFEIICFTICIAFVIFICMYTYARIFVRHHKELKGYEESYRVLAETFGEAGLEYDYLKDEMVMFGNKLDKIELPKRVEQFYEKLDQRKLPITLSTADFEAMLFNQSENESESLEFQCKVKGDVWHWYRLIYIVVCTSESHSRPIRLIGCLVDIEKEYKEKERLLELSSKDRLTGLLNRTGAERLILKRLEEKTDKEEDILLLLDVDYFKLFNDNYGHLCGDAVLCYLGEKLKSNFSTENVLCRWGGDEFLVYLENINGSVDIVKEIISYLQEDMEKFQYKEANYPVQISIGGIRVAEKENWEYLFKKVDEALYKVKEKGRNGFIIE